MIAKIKDLFNKGLTKLVSFVKTTLTVLTLFACATLFVLFFVFMYKGLLLNSLVCLAGIYTFIHLNEVI